MSERANTVSIRVEQEVLAALDMISARNRALTGKPLSFSQAIWELVKDARPEVYSEVQRLMAEGKQRDNDDDDK